MFSCCRSTLKVVIFFFCQKALFVYALRCYNNLALDMAQFVMEFSFSFFQFYHKPHFCWARGGSDSVCKVKQACTVICASKIPSCARPEIHQKASDYFARSLALQLRSQLISSAAFWSQCESYRQHAAQHRCPLPAGISQGTGAQRQQETCRRTKLKTDSLLRGRSRCDDKETCSGPIHT